MEAAFTHSLYCLPLALEGNEAVEQNVALFIEEQVGATLGMLPLIPC